MVTDDEVLEFFRKNLPEQGTLTFKRIPLKMDDVLQAYCESDDIIYAVNDYGEKFNVDVSKINGDCYFPWKAEWFFRKWFTRKNWSKPKKH